MAAIRIGLPWEDAASEAMAFGHRRQPVDFLSSLFLCHRRQAGNVRPLCGGEGARKRRLNGFTRDLPKTFRVSLDCQRNQTARGPLVAILRTKNSGGGQICV